MSFNDSSVAVIILNWNGWKDTIECLNSVLQSNYSCYYIILIDNHSSDGSVERIKDWASGKNPFRAENNSTEPMAQELPKPLTLYHFDFDHQNFWDGLKSKFKDRPIDFQSIFLIQNSENVGFAAGNNLGIKIDQILFNCDYLYLLNNDVVIEPDTMKNLVNALEENPAVGAASSAIYYYSEPKKIANLGGQLFWWGTQRYYTKPTSEKIKFITFTSGCSLMIRRSIVEKYGPLSENFFFGEEDFEFSLRLKKNKVPMMCVTRSKVYHKESQSSGKLFNELIKKKFIHVFNRFIDMKNYYPSIVFAMWRWVMLGIYFFWLMIKHRESIRTSFKFVKALHIYTRHYSDAQKTTIDKIYADISL